MVDYWLQRPQELRQLDEKRLTEPDWFLSNTSDDHAWARQAREGDPEYLQYYFTYPDRELPYQFQKYLRDIFPTVRRGSFTWNEDMKRWVWTTFNSYQWGLNYANPEVMRAMVAEMFFLANQGVEIFRLDAVPFIWKRLGTTCENQPEAYTVIRAFNAMAKIVVPCVLFKSEAIVRPDKEMVKLFRLRKKIPAFRNGGLEVISTGNPHLFGYRRMYENQIILIVTNFSDRRQIMSADRLQEQSAAKETINLLTDERV